MKVGDATARAGCYCEQLQVCTQFQEACCKVLQDPVWVLGATNQNDFGLGKEPSKFSHNTMMNSCRLCNISHIQVPGCGQCPDLSVDLPLTFGLAVAECDGACSCQGLEASSGAA